MTARPDEPVLDPYAERILEAARVHLVRDGLRRTSLDDVARTAGVGRATLFRRFPNRTALLQALAMREARQAIAAVDATLAGVEEPEEFLTVAVRSVIDRITTNEIVRRLLVTDADVVLAVASTQGSPILALGREYIAGHLRRLTKGIEEPATGPQLDAVAELLARLVLSLALNPESVLPLGDDDAMASLLRATVVPWLVAVR